MKLEDKARLHHATLGAPPEENAKTGWLDEVTILQLAAQTAGFEKPGGFSPQLFKPGTMWDYSDSGMLCVDGTLHLVFSGDDHFSVRQGSVVLRGAFMTD